MKNETARREIESLDYYLQNHTDDYSEDKYIKEIDHLRKYISKLETQIVEQEPKTGHWIFIGNSDVNGLKICKCDACGKRTYGSHNFCPNCGARMVEPQESEEEA